MTSKLLTKSSLVASAIVLASFNAFTWSSQAPANANGSPASNGNTCANPNCHSGPAVSDQTVSISTNIPASGFVGNTDYTITVTADRGMSTASTSGFSVSVESGAGSEGTLSLGANNNVTLTGMNEFATHNSDQAFSGGQSVWTFNWNSGSNTPDGTIIYTAVNFANNNGMASGDVIVTETLTLTKDGGNISVAEACFR